MTLTAIGPISRPIYKTAALIASCPEWWETICNVADAYAGLERIHWPEASDVAADGTEETLDADLPADERPRAIVRDGGTFQAFTKGEQGASYISGSSRVSLEIPIPAYGSIWPEAYWPEALWPANLWPLVAAMGLKNEQTWLTNRVGQLIREMMIRRGRDPAAGEILDPGYTHLQIRRISFLEQPALCDPREYNGNYFGFAVLLVEWEGSDG